MAIIRRDFFKRVSLLSAAAITNPFQSFADDYYSRVEGSHLKLSLNVYSFNQLLRNKELDLLQLIDFCAEENLQAIDPTGYYFPNHPAIPDREYINDFKRKAFLNGIDISGTGIRNDFTNPDSAARQKDLRHIKEWIEVAADLGAPLIRVFAGKGIPEGYTQNQVNEWVIESLLQVADHGEKYGVMIALQNHNDFIKNTEHIHEIMQGVNHPWFGLHLDIGSLRQGNPYEEIKKVVKYAITWQIKELVYDHGKALETDLVKVFKIARESGYRGYLPLETLGAGDPFEKVKLLTQKAKQALAEI